VVRIVILPDDQGACGESLCIAIRLARLKRGGGGTGRPWCRYVTASVVAMSLVIVKLGDVTFCSGSITVKKLGQVKKPTKWLFPLCQTLHREGAYNGPM